jgi:hypothetical protein
MNRTTSAWLLGHWRELIDWLPAPGVEWQVKDIDEFPYNSGQILTSKGIANHVERSVYGQPATYETDEKAWERLQEMSEQANDE